MNTNILFRYTNLLQEPIILKLH